MATQIFFVFIPIPGEMIQFDQHVFQMGWFNHQLRAMILGSFEENCTFLSAVDPKFQFLNVQKYLNQNLARKECINPGSILKKWWFLLDDDKSLPQKNGEVLDCQG